MQDWDQDWGKDDIQIPYVMDSGTERILQSGNPGHWAAEQQQNSFTK